MIGIRIRYFSATPGIPGGFCFGRWVGGDAAVHRPCDLQVTLKGGGTAADTEV